MAKQIQEDISVSKVMIIKVKNLGALRQAEFCLGGLTIICGENNTGKTYATYALFGFLHTWRKMLSVEIDSNKINQLLSEGSVRIDLQEYIKQTKQILIQGCQVYTKELPKIFAAPVERFNEPKKETEFNVNIEMESTHFKRKFQMIMGSTNAELFSITKIEESAEIVITLLVEKEKVEIPHSIISEIIASAIKEIIFTPFLPRPFIASAERTGTVIFRKELNFARNRLLEEMSQSGKNINRMELLFKVYQDYALPIEENVDFARELETLFKKRSFISEVHPNLLTDFADIIGGEYIVTSNDELYYVPKGKRVKLSMDEGSSAVRSLLHLGFYLRHEAQEGDLLIVDEPELNLHPENQRRIVRLFARLVNIGIKVFVTTHSDYIIKELNTLIMLNHDKPHLKRIAAAEGYRPEELISSEKIKVYIAQEDSVLLEGKARRSKVQTLSSADIDPEMGIKANSFDKTIETMNRIQEQIVWGED